MSPFNHEKNCSVATMCPVAALWAQMFRFCGILDYFNRLRRRFGQMLSGLDRHKFGQKNGKGGIRRRARRKNVQNKEKDEDTALV